MHPVLTEVFVGHLPTKRIAVAVAQGAPGRETPSLVRLRRPQIELRVIGQRDVDSPGPLRGRVDGDDDSEHRPLPRPCPRDAGRRSVARGHGMTSLAGDTLWSGHSSPSFAYSDHRPSCAILRHEGPAGWRARGSTDPRTRR